MQRKKLEQEAEFYVGREMPLPLRNALETNDVRRMNQEKTIAESDAVMVRTNREYDEKVRRYRELTKPPPGSRSGPEKR